MNVWRKQTIRYRLNGRNVPKGTPDAKRHVIESKRFYGTLTLRSGKRKQQPLTEDRDTSETLLRRLQVDEDTKRANGADRFYDDRQRPLLTTLAAWRSRKTKPIGVATSNHYLIAVKSFSRWLWTERKTADDPLAGLRRMNAETDRKRVRRPLTPAELETLTEVTQSSPRTFRGNGWQFTGTDRAMLYRIAALTGLRARECSTLTKSSFDFVAMTWTLPASATKNRKAVTLPLSPELASQLHPWIDKLKRETLFPGNWVNDGRTATSGKCIAGKMLKRDLKRAGIAYVDASGRFVDFHALRYTFITSLAKAGVHPAKAQRLARHSTVALTMNVYTTLDVDDLRDSIAAIAPPAKS